MEELISRPFVGQIQFQLVLLKRIETESAVGCLVFSLALTFFVSQKFAVLKAGQLAGPLFGNMVGKMRNTCEHQRVRRLRLQLRMSGAGAKLSKGLKSVKSD